MSALLTFCGFYCAVGSAVGIYFFLVIGIMEYRQNQALKYNWNVQRTAIKGDGYDDDGSLPADIGVIDMNMKGRAFMILALIQAIFFTGCCICGTASARADKAAEEREFKIKRDE